MAAPPTGPDAAWRGFARGFLVTALCLVAGYLALALELQLACDILSTAVAPTWERIGKLAAIAVIRTALNFFLSREMREAQAVPGIKEARDG